MFVVEANCKRYFTFSGGGYWIDIIEYADSLEAWLTPHNYGESHLMFGCPKKQENGHDVDYDGFLEMVEKNLNEYILDWELYGKE